jgi:hypothetical protein
MTDYLSGRRAPVLLFAVLLFLFNVACNKVPTWTTEARSPDGMWTATARTFEYSGFGTGSVETTVEIERSRQSGRPERVLAFADGGRDMALEIRWDDSRHLVAKYRGAPELLYYQVVKTSGLDISVQNLSSTNDFHPSGRP